MTERKVLIGLLVCMSAFQLLTMPAHLYPGDNQTSRIAAIQLLNTGSLGTPYSKRHTIKQYLHERGQYFYENNRSQKLYSKYGILNTLVYIPPLAIDKWRTGTLAIPHNTDAFLLILQLYNMIFVLCIGWCLFAMAGLYTQARWLRVGFVLASCYTTYLWYYLRSPTLELYQIALFLLYCYHFLRYQRATEAQRNAPDSFFRGVWRHLFWAHICAGLLVLSKTFFGLLFVPLWLFSLLQGPAGSSLFAALRHNLVQHKHRYVLALCFPACASLAVLFVVNQHKFGAPLNMGYGQWKNAQGGPMNHFGLSVFPVAFRYYLLRGGNGNLFLHYPLLIVAGAGFVTFFRRYRREALFLAFLFASNFGALCFFSAYHGERCYGPRYLVMIAIVAALPALLVVERWSHWSHVWKRRLAWGLVGCVLCLSFASQYAINSLHYFAYHHSKEFLVTSMRRAYHYRANKLPKSKRARWKQTYHARHKALERYYDVPHRSLIHADLRAYREHGTIFKGLALLLEMAPEGKPVFRKWMRFFASPNFYWFQEKEKAK